MADATLTRRNWAARVTAAFSALVLSRSARAATTCPAAGGIPEKLAALPEIREIVSGPDRVLRATITVEDQLRALWMPAANPANPFKEVAPNLCREGEPMRFFSGAVTAG